MAEDGNGLHRETAALRAALERTVEAHAAETDGLAALRQVMLEATEHNLTLHRKTLKMLESIRREMERMKRSLRRLGTARS